jgi:multidrug resistance efflux pump
MVSAQTAGRIQQLAVDEGSWVRTNDLIASLDRDELEAERRRQEAHILQLTARLEQVQELVSFQEETTQELIARATAQVDAAKSRRQQSLAELEQLKRDLERYEALLEAKSLTRQEYERQLSSVQSGEARLRAIDKEISSADADLNLARTSQRQVASAQQEVKQTEALLMQARAQLEQTNTRLAYAVVRAPSPGLISLRVAAEGEMIRAGDPIVTIVDLNDVWVTAGVEESSVSRVLLGQTIPVELASGERLQGTVTSLSPKGVFATQRDVNRIKRDIRTFEIKVRLPNETRSALPGMTAYVVLPSSIADERDQDSISKKSLPPVHP